MSDSQSSPSIRAPRSGGANTAASSKRNRSRIWLLILAGLLVLAVLAAVASARYWKPILYPYIPWATSSNEDVQTPNPTAGAVVPDNSDASASNDVSKRADIQPSPPQSTPDNKSEPSQLISPPQNAGDHAAAAPDAANSTLQMLADDQRKLAVTVSEVAGRLDKLEAAVQRNGDQAHTDRVLVLAAAQLQDALSRSAPYEPALAVLQALGGNDQQLAPLLSGLASNAHEGVKSRAFLEQELRLLEPVLTEPLTEERLSWWQEAIDRAKHLVSVRHVADPAHPESSPAGPSRSLAIAEIDLLKDDLQGAIQEMSTLQGDAAERSKPWMKHAQARWDAEQAAAKIEAVLTQRLAAPEEAPR